MNLLETLILLEGNDDYHLGRLLLLLRGFGGRRGDKCISGLTKLVKLDFLLRYPTYLERALKNQGAPGEALVKDYEGKSVESKMIRFKYGPWDPRYRGFINMLVAKGLVWVQVSGRTVNVGLTARGVSVANNLARGAAYEDVVRRAALLKRWLDLTGTHLMQRIYKWFPEIGSLRMGGVIEP